MDYDGFVTMMQSAGDLGSAFAQQGSGHRMMAAGKATLLFFGDWSETWTERRNLGPDFAKTAKIAFSLADIGGADDIAVLPGWRRSKRTADIA